MNNRVKIKIEGKNTDYFLKQLIRNNTNIYDIEKYDNKLLLVVDYDIYEKIKEIKTTYKISIINYYGINKIINTFKKNLIFIIILLIGILINIFLSNIIFKVEVLHPNKNLVNIITKDLNELGLKKYRFKISNDKKEEIKEKLLNIEKDRLEWLEIEEQGTKYIVRIEEKKKNKKEKECPPRNIISNKNALIIDIDASEGEIQKKKNDYVEKGEVIISGFIYNNGKVVSKKCSVGTVYGETWYKVLVSVPKEKTIIKEYPDKNYGVCIDMFNKEYNFLNRLKTYKKSEYNIIKGTFTPIKVSISKYQKVAYTKKKYSLNDIDKEALSLSTKKINKKLSKDESIISKKILKKSENNSKIEVEVFFKIKENITKYQDISDIDIEEMNEKEE